ncbi:MAG: DUF3330 domain-containing protein [Thiohalomonadales bacterium]
MNTKIDLTDEELISCEICIKEFPACDAKISEIDDYVMHFCGLECYDKWHKQAKKKVQIA